MWEINPELLQQWRLVEVVLFVGWGRRRAVHAGIRLGGSDVRIEHVQIGRVRCGYGGRATDGPAQSSAHFVGVSRFDDPASGRDDIGIRYRVGPPSPLDRPGQSMTPRVSAAGAAAGITRSGERSTTATDPVRIAPVLIRPVWIIGSTLSAVHTGAVVPPPLRARRRDAPDGIKSGIAGRGRDGYRRRR